MHAIFSRRVVVIGSSSQLTKLVAKQPKQSRHFLSHLLPSRLSSPPSVPRFVPSVVSRSVKVHGIFAGTFGNTNLKLKFRNVMESRVGFFSSQLPSYGFTSGGFTGLQKRGWVVVIGSSSQLTKLVAKQPKQSRHFLSHLLPSRLSSPPSVPRFVPSVVSRSVKVHGIFAGTFGNTNLKLKFRNVMESRVGFFSSQLPSYGFTSGGFTGLQKSGWKSWINGANGVVYGLIIANAAVFTMWRVSDRAWMAKNFVLSRYSFMTGRIHTLITSGFSHIGTSQIIMNMIGLYYFGTRIARTLGPLYLLKLYFAGALGSSVFFLSNHALLATLKGQGVVTKDQSKPPISQLGADGSVFAITLLDMFLYPKVTTYYGFMLRVPVMAGILELGLGIFKILEGKTNNMASSSGQLGGVVVAALAWARIRKGRF